MPRPLYARAALLLALGLAPALTAQTRPVEEAEEPGGQTVAAEGRLYDQLVSQFQREYLRFTALIQAVPFVPLEEAEGNRERFDLAAARLGIAGRLDGGIGYFLRGEFAKSPALLDVYVSYGSDDARVLVGQQKVPFSREFITGAGDIDFVNRARVVRALVPGRQVGAAFRVSPGGGPLVLRGGVFNASFPGDLPQARRGGVLLAGRAQGTFPLGDGVFEAGANVAYDTPDTSDQLDVPGRLLAGADARLRLGRVLLAAEAIAQRVSDTPALDRDGGFITAGFDVTEADRVLVRIDHFRSENELLLGYNRTLTRAASVQANAAVPLDEDDPNPARLVFNFQLSF